MAWRYRRSIRLPLGFRLNGSRRGVSWSWGFKGYRITHDSKGNTIRTISIPGTGLYNREVIGNAAKHSETNTAYKSPNRSVAPHGSYVLFIIFLLLCLCSLGVGLFPVAMLFFIFALVSFAARIGRNLSTVSREPDNQSAPLGYQATQPQTSNAFSSVVPAWQSAQGTHVYDSVVIDVKHKIGRLEPILKEQLRQFRAASKAHGLLEAEIDVIIARTGLNGDKYSDEAVDLQLRLNVDRHPSLFRLVDHASMARIMNESLQGNRNILLPEKIRPLSLQFFEAYDLEHNTQFALEAVQLFLQVAEAAAVSSGSIPAEKEAVLAQLAAAFAV